MKLKTIYKKLFNFFESLPSRLNHQKTKAAEIIAIYRKRKLYSHICWTSEQQKEFDAFWIENYGKKISNRWHKLYQSINGIFNIEYFPEILFTTKLEPKFNPYLTARILQDKSLVEILLQNTNNSLSVPITHIVCCSGIYYDSGRKIISKNEAIQIIKKIDQAVIKVSIDSSSGKDVKIINFDNLSDEELLFLINEFEPHFIIQEKITQHECISKIYSKSINTLRVITYTLNGETFHMPISFRIGSGGSSVDNIHAGGICIAVEDNGKLDTYAYKLGYCDNSEKHDRHPDTGVEFKNQTFDFIPKLCQELENAHGNIPHIGMISWDIAIDELSNFVVIEMNLIGQSCWFPQVISGKSLFGKNTKTILNLLRINHD